MPDLAGQFRVQARSALAIADFGEAALQRSPRGAPHERLHYRRLELLYELAYLRTFVAWEAFLEDTFLRYMCGQTSRVGSATPIQGTAIHRNIAAAHSAVMGNRGFALWHDPNKVLTRSKRYFTSCPIETVLSSASVRLTALGAIRHRIAHAQADAKTKFDNATMSLAGRRYMGSRAGAFLRDVDTTSSPSARWLVTLATELEALARQIA